MIGIYLLFYIGTLLLVVPGIKSKRSANTVLLSKGNTIYIKGIAALSVFLAHAQNFLASNNEGGVLLKSFSVLGGWEYLYSSF